MVNISRYEIRGLQRPGMAGKMVAFGVAGTGRLVRRRRAAEKRQVVAGT